MKISHLSLSSLLATTLATSALANAPIRIGDPIHGLTPEERALFFEGKALFEHDFTVAEGLGPLHNGPACSTCHNAPVTGGGEAGTANNVHHVTIEHDGQTYLAFQLGGPVMQFKTITQSPSDACQVQPEQLPTAPGSRVSIRHTPPVFGFGLLDAVPDDEIRRYEGASPYKRPGVIGVANWGVELEGLGRLLAFSLDPTRTQPIGAPRVGRFGWKGFVGTLFQFTTEPFNIELGVSTPFFPRENMPDGSIIPPECRVANQPNDVGSQGSLRLFYFQAFLAPPPRGPITAMVENGEQLFRQVGCADCHRPRMTTARNYYVPWPDGTAHRVEALSNKTIEPYSDLLVHDMGDGLADHRPQGRASGRFWRTTPLWGIRFKTRYLHDGSASTEEEAILAHGGEATWSTQAFLALSPKDRAALLDFLKSL